MYVLNDQGLMDVNVFPLGKNIDVTGEQALLINLMLYYLMVYRPSENCAPNQWLDWAIFGLLCTYLLFCILQSSSRSVR